MTAFSGGKLTLSFADGNAPAASVSTLTMHMLAGTDEQYTPEEFFNECRPMPAKKRRTVVADA